MTTTKPTLQIVVITPEVALEWDIDPGFDVIHYVPGCSSGRTVGHFETSEEAQNYLNAIESGSVVPTFVE